MNIIVTGASRGIGYEVARKFASDRSNSVLVISRNKKKLNDLKKACMEADQGSHVIVMPFDLEDLKGIETGLKYGIAEHFNSLDIFINNAGLLFNKPVMEMDLSDAQRMMTVNYLALMILVRSLMPLLEKPLESHVVNIGSMAGVQGGKKFAGLSAYSASKAAVHVLTECLAEEFKDSGISFNALALGSVQTEMLAEAFPELEAPLKPDEMADFIVGFALSGNRYFNGKTLPVAIPTP